MKRWIITFMCFGLAGFLATTIANAEDAPEPYPLDYWALREVINRVQVSPDGKHLALMKIPSKRANPIIEVEFLLG